MVFEHSLLAFKQDIEYRGLELNTIRRLTI